MTEHRPEAGGRVGAAATFFQAHPIGVVLLALATLVGTGIAVAQLFSTNDAGGAAYTGTVDSCRVGGVCGDTVPILQAPSLEAPVVHVAVDGESLTSPCHAVGDRVVDESGVADPYSSEIWFFVSAGGSGGYIPDTWFGRQGPIVDRCSFGAALVVDEVVIAIDDSGASRSTPIGDSFELEIVPGSCPVTVCDSRDNAIRALMTGFTPDSPVEISVTLPDGRDGNEVGGQYSYIDRATTDPTGDFMWRWWGAPGDQLGVYSTTVLDVATGRTLTAEFELTE